MGIQMPKFGPDRHRSSPRYRDALTRVDKAKRVVVAITHSAR